MGPGKVPRSRAKCQKVVDEIHSLHTADDKYKLPPDMVVYHHSTISLPVGGASHQPLSGPGKCWGLMSKSIR